MTDCLIINDDLMSMSMGMSMCASMSMSMIMIMNARRMLMKLMVRPICQRCYDYCHRSSHCHGFYWLPHDDDAAAAAVAADRPGPDVRSQLVVLRR